MSENESTQRLPPDATQRLDTEKTLLVSRPPDSTLTIRTITEERRSVVAMLQSPVDAPSTSTPVATQQKYEIAGELGKGGVGRVLKVVDRDLKREVAMKMLLPAALAGNDAQRRDALVRFIEEAQATGQLEHPNIVPVHDLGLDGDGNVYFTLKYVQGHSFKQAIRGRNQNTLTEDGATRFRALYSPKRMVDVLISICQAVAYAHSKGIIHRDLKPDNVMLGKYGEVLVMDWGLAKVLGKEQAGSAATDTVRISTTRAEDMAQATIDGSVAGTPAYMSPEQASGRIGELDERTDIYALGAILYEILTGAPPYRGGALEIVKRVLAGPPPALKTQKGAVGFTPIPRELTAICERAMARRPQDRYPTATAMRDDLRAFLENLPVSAAPDTLTQRIGKWAKRNRRQVQSAALSAAVVIVLVGGAWLGWHEWRLYQYLTDAQKQFNTAREQYKYTPPPVQMNGADPYADQTNRSIWAQKAAAYRNAIQQAVDPARKALDLSPNNLQARSLIAEADMELWRLAIREDNTELARVTRREVENYAPDPGFFSAELNGYGSVIATFDAPDAEPFLFRFETLSVPPKDGVAQPARLIPVPYDVKHQSIDTAFLQQEQKRISAGQPVPVDKHSIFNLEPSPTSRLVSGSRVVIPELAPGSYLLLVRAPGRIESRIALRMDRLARINAGYRLPKIEENPPGFFYMAGGDVIIGGDTAGAPARHAMKVDPAWIYHDEVSMGEYGAFLQFLFKGGKKDEARQRLPKDFGKNIGTLGSDGQLLPAEQGVDTDNFAKSPVRGVSFNDADAYIEWRGKQDGLPYRLPKDWEWEASCRGADGRKYSWGDTPGKGLAVVTQGYGDMGNKMSWKWEDYKDESPWGIHNLAGGVAEWTMSLFDPNAKPEDPVFQQHAIRGNAWALPPVGLECAFRTSGQPDYFHPTIGFRLALDSPYTRTGPPAGTPADTHAGHEH
jgi:serine/threonine protein kinase/formylglycine-generating enzyme required for sulfatase activity